MNFFASLKAEIAFIPKCLGIYLDAQYESIGVVASVGSVPIIDVESTTSPMSEKVRTRKKRITELYAEVTDSGTLLISFRIIENHCTLPAQSHSTCEKSSLPQRRVLIGARSRLPARIRQVPPEQKQKRCIQNKAAGR